MIKTISCVDCGESVPYGRLSCPVCGALLASVAGARGPSRTVVKLAPDPEPAIGEMALDEMARDEMALDEPTIVVESVADMAVAHALAQTRTEALAALQARATMAARAAPAVRAAPAAQVARAVPAAQVAPAAPPAPRAPAAQAAPAAPPVPAAPAQAAPAATSPGYVPARVKSTRNGAAQRATREAVAVAAPTVVPLIEPSLIASAPQTPWAPLVEPMPKLTPRPYRSRAFVLDTEYEAAPAPTPAVPPPSHYRPPTLALAVAAAPALAAATAPSWPTASRWPSIADPVVAEVATPIETPVAKSPLGDLVDAARFVEIAGWFVIVGATMSVLGILLPWSRTVIGSSGIGGYFNTWGLASPTHALILVGLLGVLGLAVVDTRVPAWLRTGAVGLGIGGLLVGVTWPYLFGPLGADIGVMVTALGGVSLVIGGAVASWATRHAELDPVV